MATKKTDKAKDKETKAAAREAVKEGAVTPPGDENTPSSEAVPATTATGEPANTDERPGEVVKPVDGWERGYIGRVPDAQGK